MFPEDRGGGRGKTKAYIYSFLRKTKELRNSQKVSNGDGPRRAGRATGFFRVESAAGLKSVVDLSWN